MRLLLCLAACAAPAWNGPVSDHFDGERFVNTPDAHAATAGDLLAWNLHRQRGAWPEWVDDPVEPPPARRLADGQLRVTWVGHATFLVQIGASNVLTDPALFDSVGLAIFGLKRVRAPGIALADLPPIDAIVVSHNHYDHMDLPSLRAISERDHPLVFAGLGNAEWLRREGIANARELDWWQSEKVGPLTLTATHVQHFSRRGLTDGQRTLWTGWSLARAGRRVYFAGDTGYGPHFRETRVRLGSFDVALLPIGAYLPRWFMAPQHVGPAEAVQAALDLGARANIAMHFDTFALADDAFLQAPRELHRVLRERRSRGQPIPDFRVPTPGRAMEL